MAITLRTIAGSGLTFEQVDTNFASLLYSGSVTGSNIHLHYTSSIYSPSTLVLPIKSSSYAETSSITQAVTGSTGYIAVFSSSKVVTDSVITQVDGRVGIGATTPQTCAALEIKSGGKGGVLLPNVTDTQMFGIDSPTAGLLVYNVDKSKMCIYTDRWEVVSSEAI